MSTPTIALACAMLITPALSSAHPKHEHKLMGTIAAIDGEQLEVDASEGERISIMLTATTSYERDGAAAVRDDLAVGQRAVVFYMEDDGRKKAVRVLLPALDSSSESQ